MSDDVTEPLSKEMYFSFLKAADDVVSPKEGKSFDWEVAAGKVREQLSDAMNARNVAFLLGSGCSSYQEGKEQLGVPTMAPMASEFISNVGEEGDVIYVTQAERDTLRERLGLNIEQDEYTKNLERLMEVLYSFQFVLKRSNSKDLKEAEATIDTLIKKVTQFILQKCSGGALAKGGNTVASIYQAFYRKLIYRDRALPRPWVFTTNYDVFNETAMDRLGIQYCNGFSGTVERRFNPATFRYSMAEQLDITSRKWTAVDNFVYLCKLHGSINWIEEGEGLFSLREMQQLPTDSTDRVMIYPTPAKQNASFGSPYSDLLREFQARIIRDQSVLFVLGYSFSDEHINNIIFQALTIPTFRVIIFLAPDATGVAAQLRELDDPRIWMIGGDGPADGRKAHYFDTFVEKFMPEPPGDMIDTAVAKVLSTLLERPGGSAKESDEDGV